MRTVGSVVCVIILIGCSRIPAASSLPATAQATRSSPNFQTLYIFEKSSGGIVPVGALLALGGTLYGTTNFGGQHSKDCYPATGCGTVYEIGPPSEESVLYRFAGKTTGTRPYAGMIDLGGTLYGTTETGGKHNQGTVFALTPGAPEHVIWSFKGKDGNFPRASLTSVNGALYGTTYYGGSTGTGTVFTVTIAGAEQVLHSFTAGKDGALPLSTLIDVNNVLYGTTTSGGSSKRGTVFEINPDGTNYSVLYSFHGGATDGAYPYAGLTDLNGTLYGTTQQGGKYKKGTVFSITTSGAESVLHSFGNGTDGSEPFAGLTVLNEQLYGTTAYGGSAKTAAAPATKKPTTFGVIYTITPSGTEQVLHNFTGGPGGRVPYANLTAMNGALYGTTIWGGRGKAGVGTVFEYSP